MATSNPVPWDKLPRLSPLLRKPASSGEIPSAAAAEQQTHPISADGSAVAPAPEPGLEYDDGANGNDTSPLAPQPPPGPTITAKNRGKIGPYQVKDVARLPGMRISFIAEDVKQQRTVMLRVIKRTRPADDPVWEAFVEGIRAAGAVKSPYIATVHEVGEDQGVLFVATEMLSGESLEWRLVHDNLP